MKFLVFIINIMFCLNCFSNENNLNEFAKNIIPIEEIQAGNDFKDLNTLKLIFNNVDIVALGEATHGTKEFFQFKHRLIEFLVSEMGFRVFAIEAPYIGCLAINDYILYGKGNRDEVLENQGYWVWNTYEFAEMLDWMRTYNSTVPDEEKIQFFGIDIPVTEDFFGLVEEYFKLADPSYLPYVSDVIQPLKEKTIQIEFLSPRELSSLRSQILKILDHLNVHRTFFINNSNQIEYEKVVMMLHVLIQHINVKGGSQIEGMEEFENFLFNHPELFALIEDDPMKLLDASVLEKYPELKTIFNKFPDIVVFIKMSREIGGRDFYMAENVLNLFKQQKPGTRMMLWAHNGHISFGSKTSMGYYLKKILGKRYYALGLTFDSGSFQAVNRIFTLPNSPEGSFPWWCSKFNTDMFILDFHSLQKEKVSSEWLFKPLLFSSIGASFSENSSINSYFYPKIVPNEFDGIAFFKVTHSATPNWNE